MANKSSFSPDEWTKILQSVVLAGIAVSAAEPSGLWGTLKEGLATGRALLEAKTGTGASELVKAIVADLETTEGQAIARDGLQQKLSGKKPAEIKGAAIDSLRAAAALVDAKAPGDAASFKIWLHHISQLVADASSEGGFLGFGGVQVSDAEKATLGEIAGALGIKT
jgi:hypothetical protein